MGSQGPGPGRVHPDNKKDDGKQDKTELGYINSYAFHHGKKVQVNDLEDRIEEEKGQT
jgi:hypothetical protein